MEIAKEESKEENKHFEKDVGSWNAKPWNALIFKYKMLSNVISEISVLSGTFFEMKDSLSRYIFLVLTVLH